MTTLDADVALLEAIDRIRSMVENSEFPPERIEDLYLDDYRSGLILEVLRWIIEHAPPDDPEADDGPVWIAIAAVFVAEFYRSVRESAS